MQLSKTFLVLIEALGLGAFGLDRLYAGCPRTGMFKLILLLSGIFMYYINEWLAGFILGAWVLFVLYDYLIVFINTLAGSPCNPFCNADVCWTDKGPAAWLLVFIVLLDLSLSVAGYYALGPFSFFGTSD